MTLVSTTVTIPSTDTATSLSDPGPGPGPSPADCRVSDRTALAPVDTAATAEARGGKRVSVSVI